MFPARVLNNKFLPVLNSVGSSFTNGMCVFFNAVLSFSLVQKIIGVFKPKSEEPYGHLNPKWTKYFHKVVGVV